jgi:hypothetical protein
MVLTHRGLLPVLIKERGDDISGFESGEEENSLTHTGAEDIQKMKARSTFTPRGHTRKCGW